MTDLLRRRIPLPSVILFALLCLFYGWASPFFWYHNDIGWHLASGDLIRDMRAIPATDPWSYTSAGAPWMNVQWLWEILASAIFQYGGGVGLLMLTVAIGAATLCLLGRLAERLGAPAGVVLWLALWVGVIFPFYEPPDIFLCVAPQQITLLFLALLLVLLWRFQQSRRRAAYATVPLLFMFWANMHGGFLAGHCLLGLMFLAALAKKDKTLAKQLLLLSLLAGGAVLVNPYGIHILDGIRGTLGHYYQRQVSEWAPFFSNFQFAFAFPALVYTGVFLSSLPYYKNWREQTPFHAALLALSLILLTQSIFALRYFSLFLLTSLPVTASSAALMLEKITRRYRKADPEIAGGFALLAAILALGAALAITVIRNPHPNDMSDIRDPKPEIEFILQHYPNARLLNHWNFGSFIIYETRGRLRPFIDGRLGTAYPDQVFVDFGQLYATQNWSAIIKKYDINVIIWPYFDDKMLAWFGRHPEWKPVFKGSLAVVLVKR